MSTYYLIGVGQAPSVAQEADLRLFEVCLLKLLQCQAERAAIILGCLHTNLIHPFLAQDLGH